MSAVLRDGITEFVFNGYTKFDEPVVHTPQCHHVREAFPPFVREPLLEVFQRFPKTGLPDDHPVKVDLLAVLMEHTYDGDPAWYRVNFCWHCMVREGAPEVSTFTPATYPADAEIVVGHE